MKVVIGLGNPGRQYARTAHNVGFMVADELARRLGVAFRSNARFAARLAEGVWGADRVLLVEPETYMNDSGSAASAVLRYRGVEPADAVVVLDDADLPLGRLRLRARGGSGGHRGLASVIAALGSDGFARVRIGIGRDPRAGDLVAQVLRPLTAAEREGLEPAVQRAADAVLCVLEQGIETAMNRFNAAPPAPGDGAGDVKE